MSPSILRKDFRYSLLLLTMRKEGAPVPIKIEIYVPDEIPDTVCIGLYKSEG